MVSPQQFSSYLRKPYDLDAAAEADLRSLIQQYPYFNNAHLLLARSLHNQKSPAFNDALRQASMFAGNRTLLYKLVNVDEKEAQKETFTPTAPAPQPELPKEQETPVAEQPATIQEPTEAQENEIKTEAETIAYETQTHSDATEETAVEFTTDFSLPLEEENTAASTTEEETAIEEPATIEEPVAETTIEAETTVETPIEETPAQEIQATAPTNEEDKVKTAYEEILGSSSAQNNIATNFESFDDEEDFVLHIDDNPSLDIMADETNGTYTKEEKITAATTSEEDFELETAYQLDADNDGIATPTPAFENAEETFELNTAEAIEQQHQEALQQAEEHQTQQAFETEIGYHLDSDGDGIIIPLPDETATEEDFELSLGDTIANSEQDDEIALQMKQSIDEEENTPAYETFEASTLEEPIAFKLDSSPTGVDAIEEETEQEAETPAPQTNVAAPQTQESVLLHQTTFYEWLEQLKGLQQPAEKKSSTTAQAPLAPKAQIENTVAITQPTAPVVEPVAEIKPQKKSSVDDIIDRFISMNPTISRPKAEFYNPTAKSKESDTERDDLATETLAKIYADQQLYDKAIDVYHRLIKLYPAKEETYKAAIQQIENGI